MTAFLIVCPLTFLSGFVDAVAGGGGLISLPAYLIAGLPVHDAVGTNKINSLMGASASAWKFIKDGHTPGKPALFCAVAALFGSAVGSALALVMNPAIFLKLMLAILPLTAFYVLFGKGFQEKPEPLGERKTIIVAAAVSFGLGVYDGFYGPGSGTFLILLLTGAARLPLTEANALSKAVSVATNAAAFVMFLNGGHMLVGLGLAAGTSSMIGSWLGVRYFETHGFRSVKWLIVLILSIFLIKVIVES